MNPKDHGPQAAEPGLPGLAELTVMAQEEYVQGCPIHVALSVRGRSTGDVFLRLPAPDWYGLNGCVGLELKDRKTNLIVFARTPEPVVDDHLTLPVFDLAPGQSRRMLVDLSEFMGVVAAGDYEMTVSYGTGQEVVSANPTPVRIRQPTPSEVKLIHQYADKRGQHLSWGMWALSAPEGGESISTDFTGANPFRFLAAVRYVLHANKDIAKTSVEPLDALQDGIFAPEGLAMKAELLKSQGKSAEYDQIKAKIAKETPELSWWMQAIDRGNLQILGLRPDP